MTVEVCTAPRLKCNLRCTYCYQGEGRKALAKDTDPVFDFEAVKREITAGMDSENRFVLFGGEPLLGDREVIEKLLAYGFETYGGTGIQTNGVLMDDDVIALFKKYNVAVGLSVDGSDTLNRARANLTISNQIEANLLKALRAGIPVSIIATLTRFNASPENLPRFLHWVQWLDKIGINRLNLHMMEMDGPLSPGIAISNEQHVAVFRALRALPLRRLRIQQFEEFSKLLSGTDEKIGCEWKACDPERTRAVHGVELDGSRSMCGRVSKDGRPKAPAPGPTLTRPRQLALYSTPQSEGGCQGCKWFLFCKGACPGTSEGGDFTKRSTHCGAYKELFADAEAELVAKGCAPVSLREDLSHLERIALGLWRRGLAPTVASILGRKRAGDEGKHTDVEHGEYRMLIPGERVED